MVLFSRPAWARVSGIQGDRYTAPYRRIDDGLARAWSQRVLRARRKQLDPSRLLLLYKALHSLVPGINQERHKFRTRVQVQSMVLQQYEVLRSIRV